MAYLAGGGLASLISEGGLDLIVPTIEVCDVLGLNDTLAADEALGRCAWSALTCSVMDSRRGFSGRGGLKYPSALGTDLGEIGDFGECEPLLLSGDIDADMVRGFRVIGPSTGLPSSLWSLERLLQY